MGLAVGKAVAFKHLLSSSSADHGVEPFGPENLGQFCQVIVGGSLHIREILGVVLVAVVAVLRLQLVSVRGVIG